MNNEAQHQLDARNLGCPLPILKAKKVLNRMEQGEIIAVTTTDPGSLKDFESFCEQTGDELLATDTLNGEFVFSIQKS